MTTATMLRVLRQLRHDPRTVGLMVIVPSVLMILLRYVLNSERVFASAAPALLGFFPFLLMFLVTSVTTLRERTSGTLERLLTTPTPKPALLLGYAAAFALVAVVQVSLAVVVSDRIGLSLGSSVWPLLLVALLDALLGVALGLFASSFARTEFQAVQFMPVVVLPQLLTCGLFQAREQMATVLQWLADALPLTYAVEALQRSTSSAGVDAIYWRDAAILLGVTLLALVLAAVTLRRQTD